jgi:hypothetical protein
MIHHHRGNDDDRSINAFVGGRRSSRWVRSGRPRDTRFSRLVRKELSWIGIGRRIKVSV